MRNLNFIIMLLMALTSCEQKTNKINHSEDAKSDLKKDSSKIEIADLPIVIDSTDYLIHPIGYISEYNSRYSSYSSDDNYTSYSVSRYNNFSIKGEFSNIKFQHINSDKLIPLTHDIIQITSIKFLEHIRKQTGLEFLVYTIRDTDTNKDSKIDFNDIVSLYISNLNGQHLKKLTPDLAQIVDWKVVLKLNRLYFKSISDSNKNGDFDKSDSINYNYIYLEDPKLTIINYYPL